MENATKALIIAGAILVAIILVTMGISLLNNTGAMQDQQKQQQNEMNVKAFNDQFPVKEGQVVRGDTITAMQEKLRLKKIDDPDLDLTIEAPAKIRETSRYKIDKVEYDDSGYIKLIKVSLNSSSSSSTTP